MKYSFKRKDEISLQTFEEQVKAQYAALEWLSSGNAGIDEIAAYVQGIIDSGRKCNRIPDGLSWGYDEPENMPSDARVAFFYMPTYLNTAFLMQSYSMNPERIGALNGFADALRNALVTCIGRRFNGSGYSKDDFVQGIMIFANIHTKEFIRTYSDLVPYAFSECYFAVLRFIEEVVASEEEYLARIANSWENNHIEDYRRIVELENGTAERKTLFVYGSLMKGRYNHNGYMEKAVFLGKGYIEDFSLYDLGYYPGILHNGGQGKVLGELYEVSVEDYERICRLEGNGHLYQSEAVTAHFEGYGDTVLAEVFVYLGNVDEAKRIPVKKQPWTEGGEEMEYVWYACYGSNLKKERFMSYINRCADRTAPKEDRPYEFAHPVFFGGVAETWGYGNRGKAFLNLADAGHAYGRIYKITHGQYLEIKNMEGRDYTRKVELGMIEGLPVITFTSENVQKRNVPCLDYLDTILDGLREVYPGLRESAVSADLISEIFSMDEIKVLNCLREEEHGLSNKEISDITSIEIVREKEVISELIGLGLVKQDSRSLQHMVTEDDAVFYTRRPERPVIDRVRMLADEEKVMRGVEPDEPLVTTVSTEGGRRRMILSTRYERKPENRQAAIRLHGTVCQVCGFNFQEHYGELGEGYIEVHHIQPLSTLDEEVVVNPETDLVCLCANCHRMMHRSRNHVMTVDELKGLLR